MLYLVFPQAKIQNTITDIERLLGAIKIDMSRISKLFNIALAKAKSKASAKLPAKAPPAVPTEPVTAAV